MSLFFRQILILRHYVNYIEEKQDKSSIFLSSSVHTQAGVDTLSLSLSFFLSLFPDILTRCLRQIVNLRPVKRRNGLKTDIQFKTVGFLSKLGRTEKGNKSFKCRLIFGKVRLFSFSFQSILQMISEAR